MREATDAGLDHDHGDQVSAHLGKLPQENEPIELAGHLTPPMSLVVRTWMLLVL